jgi:large subunit ribosomal protein L13
MTGMKTITLSARDLRHHWYVVDATGVPLGRLASRVAQVIRGKHKPTFTPHLDTGDGVIVVNAAKVRLTGRKLDQKAYFSHTGYMGHDRLTPVRSVLASKPERVVEKAVFGMLPKTSLSRQVLRRKLRVYAGPEHPHAAQQPQPLDASPKTKTRESKTR